MPSPPPFSVGFVRGSLINTHRTATVVEIGKHCIPRISVKHTAQYYSEYSKRVGNRRSEERTRDRERMNQRDDSVLWYTDISGLWRSRFVRCARSHRSNAIRKNAEIFVRRSTLFLSFFVAMCLRSCAPDDVMSLSAFVCMFFWPHLMDVSSLILFLSPH